MHEVECTEPDSCNAGLILRNGVCIKPCADGEIFASPDSNTCINCETTPYQGIVIKTEKKKVGLLKKREKEIQYETCLKCDKDTQFFNRQTKQCVPKENFSAVSMESIRACWMCPGDMQKDCVMEMGKPESERGFAINNWGEIKRRCHIE